MIPYIDIHTHSKIIRSQISLYNLSLHDVPDEGYNSFGMHPWELGTASQKKYLEKLEEYCRKKYLKAVGEIGIDRSIAFPVEQQMELFNAQHLFADKFDLPVIIHCVKAWSDLLELRKKQGIKRPWIFHGYNGNAIIAQQLIESGCYLSFGHQLLANKKLQQVFEAQPLKAIFLETDNSHENIATMYEKAADLHHICIENLKEIIFQNYRRIFE